MLRQPEDEKKSTSDEKLVPFSEIPDNKKPLYQRESRQQEKDQFRADLIEKLGPKFEKIAKSLDKYGMTGFKDFVDPAIFREMTAHYDKLMKAEGKQSSTFAFNFANLVKTPEFLTNQRVKDSFFHPLLIALIAYQTGGPIRLVDARAKNAGSAETLVRDNGPHLDDNPFSDEWKLLVSWLLDQDGNSLDAGPQGQPFVSFPGSEVLVRKQAREYGANFKNPRELLKALTSKSLDGKVFGIESKDSRPFFVIFEASHQIHHRKRSEKEPPRACYIESFHIVDPKNNPPTYFSRSEDQRLVTDDLDRFLMCGEGTADDFVTLINGKKSVIVTKIDEIEQGNHHVEAHEKMMTSWELIKYFHLMIETHQKEMLESRKDLRFKRDELKEMSPEVINKLRLQIGERDKHYDLDLIVYPDNREQMRKVPRTFIRESGVRNTDIERFKKLKINTLPDVNYVIDEQFIQKYAKEFQCYGDAIYTEILALAMKNASFPPEFEQLLNLLNSEEQCPEKTITSLIVNLEKKPGGRQLAEIVRLFQLIKDLSLAFNGPYDDILGIRATSYFLYLTLDYMCNLSFFNDMPEIRTLLDTSAQHILQKYFDFVIFDDLTYENKAKQQKILDAELYTALSNVLTKESSRTAEVKCTESAVPGSIKFSESILFLSQKKHFPKEAEISVKSALTEKDFFEGMLKVAAKDKNLQDMLHEFALEMNNRILQPLIDEIRKFDPNKPMEEQISGLPEHYQKCIKYFLNEHSNVNNQKLGIMSSFSPAEILSGRKLLPLLLKIQERSNLKVKQEIRAHDIEKTIKIINELACCYIDFFPKQNPNYYKSEGIMPSSEEASARIKREEKTNSAPEVKGDKKKYLTGKEMFSSVSLLERAQIETEKYDKLKAIERTGVLTEEKKKSLDASESFMKKYGIPFNVTERKNLSQYIKASTIETILRISSEDGSMPLMAGMSTSESRTLRAFYDLGLLHNSNGTFNFDRAQILSNLSAAILSFGDHHSFLELVEPYNRLLATAGIEALENGNLEAARQAQTSQFPLVKLNQHMIPNFFHPQYRSEVIAEANEIVKKRATPVARL